MRFLPIILAGLLLTAAEAPHDSVPKDSNLILFSGSVNPENVVKIALAMTDMARTQPYIVLVMNSSGGNVSAGLVLSELIENLGKPVYCIVSGRAYSMAFFVLQSCTWRAMTQDSTLMIHNPSIEPAEGGDEYYFERTAQSLRAMGIYMAFHYARRMNVSVADIRNRIMDREWLLEPLEAYGVMAVDDIVKDIEGGRLSARVKYLTSVPAPLPPQAPLFLRPRAD